MKVIVFRAWIELTLYSCITAFVLTPVVFLVMDTYIVKKLRKLFQGRACHKVVTVDEFAVETTKYVAARSFVI